MTPPEPRPMTDGPNTHRYPDANFVTEWHVFRLDETTNDGPVEHVFHVPSRIVELIEETQEAALAMDALRAWLDDPLRDYLDERDRAYLRALATPAGPEHEAAATPERLREAADAVDSAWNDEGDHLEYHEELPERLLTLRAALASPGEGPLDLDATHFDGGRGVCVRDGEPMPCAALRAQG